MVRPRRPPPLPLTTHAARGYRRLFRLALQGPLWTPLAMAAVAFLLPVPLPLLWGGGPGLGGPWRVLSLVLAATALVVGLSAWPARYRLYRDARFERQVDEIRRLPREQVAELVGEAYRRAGYSVLETGRAIGTGVDLELRGRRGTTLVQCRHRDPVIDVRPLSELCAQMRQQQAGRGVVLATGRFTDVAGSYARVHGITLVEARTLLQMIRVTRAEPEPRRLLSGRF